MLDQNTNLLLHTFPNTINVRSEYQFISKLWHDKELENYFQDFSWSYFMSLLSVVIDGVYLLFGIRFGNKNICGMEPGNQILSATL